MRQRDGGHLTGEAAIRRSWLTVRQRCASATPTICRAHTVDAVVDSLAPPLVQPPNSTRDVARMQAWFDEQGRASGSRVRDLHVTIDTDLALCISLKSMGAPPVSTQPPALWYRSTFGLRRLAGQWRIIHEQAGRDR